MFNQAKCFAISAAMLATLAAMTAPASAPAAAQAPTLAGKTVTMVIGSGTGGANDMWGRLVALHMSKHLPGRPTVIPQNMPGGGGMNAANHIYNIAPKDGTALGIIVSAIALGRYLESLLFQVSPRDPLAFAVSGTVLLAVSVAACLIPARRATRVSPTEALRFE
jgi:tripartite-type tricarboxylate transporter receptor subunit TctC